MLQHALGPGVSLPDLLEITFLRKDMGPLVPTGERFLGPLTTPTFPNYMS